MAKYFIGNILLKENINLQKYTLSFKIKNKNNLISKFKIDPKPLNFNKNDYKNLIEVINGAMKGIKTYLNTKTGNKLLENITYKKSDEIIFEVIKDKFGKEYAKEILTGFVFPIFNKFELLVDLKTNIIKKKFDKNLIQSEIIINYDKRINFNLCNCYCVKYKEAEQLDIEKYIYKNYNSLTPKHSIRNSQFYLKIKELFDKNIFDDSVIIKNSNNEKIIVTENNNPLPSSSSTNNNLNTDYLSIKTFDSEKSSINNQLELLKKIKDILPYLPDEDINLLRDLTNNNFDDPNLIEYLKMPKVEKLEVLASRLQYKSLNSNNEILDIKPKVSLKKK